ncbi:hypothetical protein GF373_16840 [bacterium]|nr:hypothetical protein [bacterium]
MRQFFIAITLFNIVFMLPAKIEAARHALIVCGSGGTEEYTVKFNTWGKELKSVLLNDMHFPARYTTLIASATEAYIQPRLNALQKCFQRIEFHLKDNDELYLFLIGHGSYIDGECKFQIPGPDLTASQLNNMLARVKANRIIMINTTSASAGFINALSGGNRVLCTAVKSVNETNATEFMHFFLEALKTGSADRNFDGRISVLEACEKAAALTTSYYKSEKLLATEHPILDDNGDGLGTPLPMVNSATETVDAPPKPKSDGALAAKTYLKNFAFPASTPRQWIEEYQTAMDAIAALKQQKSQMETDIYYKRLESLLIQAAKISRKIRSQDLQARFD